MSSRTKMLGMPQELGERKEGILGAPESTQDMKDMHYGVSYVRMVETHKSKVVGRLCSTVFGISFFGGALGLVQLVQ